MHDRYENPLCRRYASREMQAIFSDDRKFSTWRRLWLALAESEQELGLNITDEQLEEMRTHLTDIDYDLAAQKEHELRHDVMAHIHTFGAACPKARPIIHLGATSCFVGDNTDVILQREALRRIRRQLLAVMQALADFAQRYKAQPALAYTHFQAAQPTTLGKRACLWLQDLEMDLSRLDFALGSLKLLGCRGTTGTAASFLELFDGDRDKVRALEKKITEKMGFSAVYPVSGQTYPRKSDDLVLSVLSGIAQSAMKFSGDIRLLSHLKAVDEPFAEGQVGSSAMAYKRNPMRSERMTSLARFVIADALNPAMTAGTQWLERTLDDSAIREELPFLATENILMYCVKKGGDRQTLHEAIRRHSVDAGRAVKEEGADNDLLDRIAADPVFGLSREEIDGIVRAGGFTGMALEQTEDYLAQIRALLAENAGDMETPTGAEVTV